jgi:hypothetical protein
MINAKAHDISKLPSVPVIGTSTNDRQYMHTALTVELRKGLSIEPKKLTMFWVNR